MTSNVETGFSLRLPNPRADVYIEIILFDTPGICSNLLDLISETINPCLKLSIDCKLNLFREVSDKNTFILIL